MTASDTASPTDLPKRSWASTLIRTPREFKEDKLNHWAAALTYYAILSLFPALLTKFLTGVIGALGLSDVAVTAWQFGKWPVMLMLVLVILHVLYFVSPNARVAGARWVSGGTILTLVVWILASAGFAFYVANFGSYGKTYGTMGGVVVFLLWLWLTNMAVLLGVEFNAETARTA